MRATHWSVEDNPERWNDDPAPNPVDAFENWIKSEGTHEEQIVDIRDGLFLKSTVEVTVHGYIHTDKILDEQLSFEGYEPGEFYYEPTGETAVVELEMSLTARVKA